MSWHLPSESRNCLVRVVLAFYTQIKWVHVAAVLLSGALFMTRGLLVQGGRTRWAMAAPVRYASYGIDTVLLAAALMLATALPGALFANHWLTVKIALLVLYIALGSAALGRAQTPRARAVCFAAAVVVYVSIIGIARAHHPAGWLALFRT
jgi:uncharacterized membrane protein SirB2